MDRVAVTCSRCGSVHTLSRQKGLKWSRDGGWICRSCISKSVHARGLITQKKKPTTIDLRCGSCNEVYTVGRKYSISKRKTSDLCHRCSMRLKTTSEKMKEGHQKFKEANPIKVTENARATSNRAKLLWEYRKTEMLEKFSAAKKRPEIVDKMRAWYSSDRFKQSITKRLESKPRKSSLQEILYSLLTDMGVTYVKEGEGTTIGFYTFDCVVDLDGKKFLIECQGDYWHSREDTKKRDKAKFTYISRYFPEYEIIYLWEYEFQCPGRVTDRLKAQFGIELEHVAFEFNACKLMEPPYRDVKSFLSSYHYLGKGRGGKVFGAYLLDKLIAVCVFSPPIRQNITVFDDFVELSRLCIHPSYHKKNFASWFVSRCVKLIGRNVISYADTTAGHLGTVYKSCNFKLHHEVAPDYWYVSDTGHIMHKKTVYNNAKKLGKTEADYASEKLLEKRYGGKKLCYTFAKRG